MCVHAKTRVTVGLAQATMCRNSQRTITTTITYHTQCQVWAATTLFIMSLMQSSGRLPRCVITHPFAFFNILVLSADNKQTHGWANKWDSQLKKPSLNEWVSEWNIPCRPGVAHFFFSALGGKRILLCFSSCHLGTLTHFPQQICMVFTGAVWRPPTPGFLNSETLCLWNVSLSR